MQETESVAPSSNHMNEQGLDAADNDADRSEPVIAVVHASVGSGHKAAAHAVAQAIDFMRGTDGVPKNVRVDVLDILDYGRIHFDGNKAAASFTGATRPIYDITWRYTLTGRLLWGGGYSWSVVMFPAFTAYIRKVKPIAVICTHITAANAAVGARMLTGYTHPIVCIPTDYEIEGWWPHKETDLFCVATDFMAETLRPRKVEENRIAITGIPVRHGFETNFNREEDRGRFKLPHDKLIVLIMAGASLPQPYVRFRTAIEQTLPFLRSFSTMHFVFLPGRDKEYSERLKRIFTGMGLENVTVMDYVEDMASLMHAADVAVLKSGGLAVTECLCARLPMILLGKSYGQEKANTTLLTSFGASMHVTTARELVSTLRRIHHNPESLHALLVNAAALRKPHAADDIVRATMGLVGTPHRSAKRFAEFYWGDKPAHIR